MVETRRHKAAFAAYQACKRSVGYSEETVSALTVDCDEFQQALPYFLAVVDAVAESMRLSKYDEPCPHEERCPEGERLWHD